MADEGPLGQPDCCPDWVYKIIHQCWAYDSTQRPPFLAIVDCLTSRYVVLMVTLMDTRIHFIFSPGQRLPKKFIHGFTLSVAQTETKASVWGGLCYGDSLIFCFEVRDK